MICSKCFTFNSSLNEILQSLMYVQFVDRNVEQLKS